jgi:hypothetical protein
MAQYFCLVGLHDIVGGAGVCLLGFEVIRYHVDIARILKDVPLPCHDISALLIPSSQVFLGKLN